MVEPLTPTAPISNEKKTGHRFQKGNPGGPGRQKGSKNIAGLLDQAIKAAQARREALKEPCTCATNTMLLGSVEDLWKKSCRTLDEHFARRAFLSDTILTAFQKKRIPDLQHQTGNQTPTHITISYGYSSSRVQVLTPLPQEANGHDA